MRISGALPPVTAVLTTTPVARVGAAKAASRPAAASDTASKANPAAVNANPSVDALLALGGVEDERERRRRMADGLFSGLELLDDLHRELTLGHLPADRLDQLSAWLSSTELPSNPRLADLMSDIALRVAVELAKLGR